MVRRILLLTLVLSSVKSAAQFPVIRSMDLRIAQQRPHVTAVIAGPLGLLWCATDAGLVRTDGTRHLMIVRTAPHAILSLAASPDGVLAATDHGLLLHCKGTLVDTVLLDTSFTTTPIRSLAIGSDGTYWLGTYGDGVRLVRGGRSERLPAGSTLSDRHVNALQALENGMVAVATDQGIDILDRHGMRTRTVDASNGAPDNLILSLAFAEGTLYAGSDRAGVFAISPESGAVGEVFRIGPVQPPVVSLCVADRAIWMGTDENGTWLWSIDHGAYAPPLTYGTQRTRSITREPDGSIWWCDGTDRVLRVDPGVLLFTEHEGVDLRIIDALDVSRDDRIVFAIGHRIHMHSTSFTESERIRTVELPLDPSAQVATVHLDRWRSVWVGTMGNGTYRIDSGGTVSHFTERNSGLSDNVLSIRSDDRLVWFATLSGVAVWTPSDSTGKEGGFRHIKTPGYGFIYDVLPMPGGRAYAATDGNGALHVNADGRVEAMSGDGEHRTYYALCKDELDRAWAVGPGTGFCRLDDDTVRCLGANTPAFEGEVYGLLNTQGRLLMLGAAGMAATPVDTMLLSDPGEAFGLAGVTAPLNGLRSDRDGSFWLACNKGLMHLRPAAAILSNALPAVITDIAWGDQPLPLVDGLRLGHEQNFLSFGFTASYPGAPELIGFQFQLEGYDRDVRTTQDRQVGYARLAPGQYVFKVRGLMPGSLPGGEWTGFHFTISAPWWETPLALIGAGLLAAGIVVLVLRGRDRRIRFKERMEREKVRFQLEAVRSQVNPHFLFNSFNTLIELIEEDRAKAVVHTQQLSDFFRNILQVRDKDLITLAEDMVLMENYYQLERRRFGDRIQLEIEVDDRASRWMVPPLTLQLLVENALKHNAATLDEPLVVHVSAHEGWLEVSNKYRPRSTSSRSTGFGLESLKKRLQVLTDRHVVARVEGDRFVVRIPLIEPAP